MHMLHFISHHVDIRCIMAMYLSTYLPVQIKKKFITHSNGCVACVICGCSGLSDVCCVESSCDHAFRE